MHLNVLKTYEKEVGLKGAPESLSVCNIVLLFCSS
jgi:hypothetical protein